jgi:hypothetical protein
MKGRKQLARLQRRQKSWDASFEGRPGFKRPGSFKKTHPAGKR